MIGTIYAYVTLWYFNVCHRLVSYLHTLFVCTSYASHIVLLCLIQYSYVISVGTILEMSYGMVYAIAILVPIIKSYYVIYCHDTI